MPQASATCWRVVRIPEEANSLAAVSRISVLRVPSADTASLLSASTCRRPSLCGTDVSSGLGRDRILVAASPAPSWARGRCPVGGGHVRPIRTWIKGVSASQVPLMADNVSERTKYLSSTRTRATVGGMKIVVDLERCQGHGRCYDIAPELFGADGEGHAVVLAPDGDLAGADEAHAARAVRSCPERALSLGG
jgi:ferredoxin